LTKLSISISEISRSDDDSLEAAIKSIKLLHNNVLEKHDSDFINGAVEKPKDSGIAVIIENSENEDSNLSNDILK
ncbi:4190_t:CDS:1, partial [Racocetra persica]